MARIALLSLAFLAVLQLAACSALLPASAALSEEATPISTPWALVSAGSRNAQAWQQFKLPGKQPSQFTYVHEDGRHAMAAIARSSASMWRQVMRIEPSELGKVKFSWKVPELIELADMTQRDADDSPVRIVLAFDGDRSKFSQKNAMLSELARLLTGEELPYATMMYVWCNECKPGSVIVNPRTDRIRKLVVESGTDKLQKWVDYERTVRADFEKVFGEAPGALMSISLMTDTDNTESIARAWYGPITLVPGQYDAAKAMGEMQ